MTHEEEPKNSFRKPASSADTEKKSVPQGAKNEFRSVALDRAEKKAYDEGRRNVLRTLGGVLGVGVVGGLGVKTWQDHERTRTAPVLKNAPLAYQSGLHAEPQELLIREKTGEGEIGRAVVDPLVLAVDGGLEGDRGKTNGETNLLRVPGSVRELVLNQALLRDANSIQVRRDTEYLAGDSEADGRLSHLYTLNFMDAEHGLRLQVKVGPVIRPAQPGLGENSDALPSLRFFQSDGDMTQTRQPDGELADFAISEQQLLSGLNPPKVVFELQKDADGFDLSVPTVPSSECTMTAPLLLYLGTKQAAKGDAEAKNLFATDLHPKPLADLNDKRPLGKLAVSLRAEPALDQGVAKGLK